MSVDDVLTVLAVLPEFRARFVNLAEAADEWPDDAAVFGELADYVSSTVVGPSGRSTELGRCTEVVEQVAATSDEAEELVGWAFLDALSPCDLSQVVPWLGPRTLAILDSLF